MIRPGRQRAQGEKAVVRRESVARRSRLLVTVCSILIFGCQSATPTGPSPWPLTPSRASDEADANSRAACARAFESADEPLTLVVADQRTGELTTSLYQGPTYSLLLVVSDEGSGPAVCETSLGGSSPDVEGSAATLTAEAAWRDGWAVAGSVEPGIDDVVIGVDGRQLHAAVGGGHFVALWPFPPRAEYVEAWRNGQLVARDSITR